MGHTFATRLSNVFIIGKGNKPWVSLPKGKGVKLSVAEESSHLTRSRCPCVWGSPSARGGAAGWDVLLNEGLGPVAPVE